jgi:hypothetical protein
MVVLTTKTHFSQEDIKVKNSKSFIRIRDWSHLHQRLEMMRDSAWIFRGVSSPEHLLIPSIGREEIYGHYKLAQEQRLFQEFKNRAVALISDSRFDDWDWLAYAQHIGVPTRLLDWSASPLVATFFALESDNDSDRVIYAVNYSTYIHEVDHKCTNPFANKMEGRFTAPLTFDRIRAQRGIFTIHPDPTNPYCRLSKHSHRGFPLHSQDNPQ